MDKRHTVFEADTGKSWGNVFEALDVENPDELEAISALSVKIKRAIKEQGLSKKDAAIRLDVSPEQLVQLYEAPFDFTISELLHCLLKAWDGYKYRCAAFRGR